ncbi:MAG: glycosyltransferase family 2 protein [Pseudomonadota bacterium]
MSTDEHINKDLGPTVSAIVVTYFTGPLLSRAIEALREQPEVREILVVDNGNWDGVVADAVGPDDARTSVKVLTGHGNIGFAAACNLGAEHATGEYLLFLNPDAVLPGGAIGQLLESAGSFERPWMVGPKLINPDGTEQQGARRNTLTPWRAFVEATQLYRFAPQHPYFRRFNLHTSPCPGEICPTPTISGACFLLHADDYQAIGGMDAAYFLHVEDVDFCLRFAKSGGKVLYDPSVVVVHYKSSSRVSRFGVERRKIASIVRYFDAHFSRAYPKPFLWLVYAVLWLGFGVREALRFVGQALSVFGLSTRRGAGAAGRAMSLSGKRASR